MSTIAHIIQMLCSTVLYLNVVYVLQKGASGKDLFDAVKVKLQLSEEADYFSISHIDAKYNISVCASHDFCVTSTHSCSL